MIKVLQYCIVVLSVNQVSLFLSSSNEALTYIPNRHKDEGRGGGGGLLHASSDQPIGKAIVQV